MKQSKDFIEFMKEFAVFGNNISYLAQASGERQKVKSFILIFSLFKNFDTIITFP